MVSQSIHHKIEALEHNIYTLLKTNQRHQEESDFLKEENLRLREELKVLKSQLSDFQNQDKIAKLVSNTTVGQEESTELKQKLNEYIKEIDRCIEHLS